MSDTPPEFEWHFDTSDEVKQQLHRAENILRQLARDLCIRQPLPPPHDPFVIDASHVKAAAELLFGARNARLSPPDTAIDVFVSYSREDVDFVQELYNDITARGMTCFKDDRSIRTGARWAEEILSAVELCRIFLLVVTSRTLSSDWCKIEAGAAWGLGKRIVVILRHVDMDRLPGPLSSYQTKAVENREQQSELIEELQSFLENEGKPSP